MVPIHRTPVTGESSASFGLLRRQNLLLPIIQYSSIAQLNELSAKTMNIYWQFFNQHITLLALSILL